MATLNETEIAGLLAPYLRGPWGEAAVPAGLYMQIATYLNLLVRWNERTNLTAIRSPEEMITRHFGESLFAGLCLGRCLGAGATVLDVGSGAGFPGLPMQLLRPDWRVTVAESQGKKAAFLREVVRLLSLDAEVWSRRVEELPAERRFDGVTLRAVDRMKAMLPVGQARVAAGGMLLWFATGLKAEGVTVPIPGRLDSSVVLERLD